MNISPKKAENPRSAINHWLGQFQQWPLLGDAVAVVNGTLTVVKGAPNPNLLGKFTMVISQKMSRSAPPSTVSFSCHSHVSSILLYDQLVLGL